MSGVHVLSSHFSNTSYFFALYTMMSDEPKQKQSNMGRATKWIIILILFLCGSVFLGSITRKYQDPLKRSPTNSTDLSWASQSFGLAPHPSEHNDPIIQIYSSRTWGAKGALAVHTWIATKKQNADHYMVSQVVGWRLKRVGTSLFSNPDIPDKGWYGKEPTLLLDLRGAEVGVIIDKVDAAITRYPWENEYSVWPGPNSNTFIAWLGLEIPELHLDLPSTAIGKDWRPLKESIGLSASGTGVQASLFGLLGTSIGREEGLEINILGLSVELDLFDLAIELPGIGRMGKAPVNNPRQ